MGDDVQFKNWSGPKSAADFAFLLRFASGVEGC